MSGKQRSQGGFFHMGTISLLTVFLVVVLVVLSLLMLSSAKQDYDYSQKLAQRKQTYFAAHNQAQQIHRQVLDALEQEEPDWEQLPVTVSETEISWQVPVGDSQMLKAVLTRQQDRWVVTCWQVE